MLQSNKSIIDEIKSKYTVSYINHINAYDMFIELNAIYSSMQTNDINRSQHLAAAPAALNREHIEEQMSNRKDTDIVFRNTIYRIAGLSSKSRLRSLISAANQIKEDNTIEGCNTDYREHLFTEVFDEVLEKKTSSTNISIIYSVLTGCVVTVLSEVLTYWILR